MNDRLPPAVAAAFDGQTVGHAPAIDTAHELTELYRSLRRAPGVPPSEIQHAREAAERWCARAGIAFRPEGNDDVAAD